jgi:antitoxin (DNA-binding transcriptional repressor) of toxin-antitoxin stability system
MRAMGAAVVRTVNMHEAKTHLSRLVDEEFIIARDGRLVARVVPIRDEFPTPRIGFIADIEVPADFDQMGSEQIVESFGAQ